ncbi:MAG TPA: nickel-dependent lactate racemase [Bryobacteraceae bacterium]|nr:nickel-dependent lactate racemase [Bryobacteraceae bacterium]
MKADLQCGREIVNFEVPDSTVLLEMKPLAPLPDPGAAVREALAHPIASPPLSELARGRSSACIVVSDITRPAPNQVILPPMLETLEAAGVAREAITILIATGMHRPNLGDELANMVGSGIMARYRIENHFCRDPRNYRRIDTIDGAPIEVNRHYLDAGLRILTGLIEPHFYAGYSGGRKAILPGISSFETMKFVHSYRMIDHPRVANCVLDGNPFHQNGLRICELAGVDFIVNVVLNKHRQVGGVFAGHYDRAHLAGCEVVERHSTSVVDEPFDLVITSGGGYPLDATFYQIAKALTCARNVLRKGGSILVVCGCQEGLGGREFSGILRSVGSLAEFRERYQDPKDFVIDQWCAQSIYQALDHAGKVYIYSPGLAGEDVERMGAIPVAGLQQTVTALAARHARVALSPEGPYVVGVVRDAVGAGRS